MREHPILFSAPMVRAILAGTKTQTRRAVKPQPQPNGGAGLHPVAPYRTPQGDWAWVLAATGMGSGDTFACPYGQPGDRLWVREAWSIDDDGDREWAIYRADGTALPLLPPTRRPSRWRPAIHMPRWASRITLEVTGVRVERLQEISEADARAEGAQSVDIVTGRATLDPFSRQGSCVWHYRHIWEQINGPGSWEANPWVWVVEFKGKA